MPKLVSTQQTTIRLHFRYIEDNYGKLLLYPQLFTLLQEVEQAVRRLNKIRFNS